VRKYDYSRVYNYIEMFCRCNTKTCIKELIAEYSTLQKFEKEAGIKISLHRLKRCSMKTYTNRLFTNRPRSTNTKRQSAKDKRKKTNTQNPQKNNARYYSVIKPIDNVSTQ